MKKEKERVAQRERIARKKKQGHVKLSKHTADWAYQYRRTWYSEPENPFFKDSVVKDNYKLF